MKAKLFDERGEVTFDAEEIEKVSIQFGGYSLLIKWKNGQTDKAESISI